MSTSRDTPPSFDPFGERVDMLGVIRPRGGRSIRFGIAAFWIVALLLVAGRIYFHDPARTVGANAVRIPTSLSVLR